MHQKVTFVCSVHARTNKIRWWQYAEADQPLHTLDHNWTTLATPVRGVHSTYCVPTVDLLTISQKRPFSVGSPKARRWKFLMCHQTNTFLPFVSRSTPVRYGLVLICHYSEQVTYQNSSRQGSSLLGMVSASGPGWHEPEQAQRV
jgi:hypothetical protein